MALLVGLTGGIGAGKSTALRELEALGQQVLDTDSVVHELYSPGTPVVEALCRRYGTAIIDAEGRINRRRLADLAFSSSKELRWLNQLVHPHVKQRMFAAADSADGLIFCAVPLLFEVGWEDDVACVVVIWCDGETQRGRLKDRGWSIDELVRRQSAQLPMDEKLVRADYAVINNSSIDVLQRQLQKIICRIQERLA